MHLPRTRGIGIAVTVLLSLAGARAWAGIERTDPQREIELGRQVAREIERRYPLSTDPSLQRRVDRIGKALTAPINPKVYPYEFKVLGTRDINAVSLPGGYIYIFEGLMAAMPNDNALAFVMGHELAHASCRHWATHTNKIEGLQILVALGSVLTGNDFGAQIAQMATELLSLHYSREQEDEADEKGTMYAWQGGFDTAGCVEAMGLIEEITRGDKTPVYLRSHPPAADRRRRIVATASELSRRPPPAPPAGTPDVDEALTRAVGALPQVTIAANPWFPLAAGNEWTYRVESPAARSAYSLRITSVIDLEGKTVYRAETVLGKGAPIPSLILTSDSEVWRRPRPSLPDSAWQIEHVLSDGAAAISREGAHFRWIGKERVSVPCGDFAEAVRIEKRVDDPPATYDLWFAPGVGLVKRARADTGITEVLMKYKVAPVAEPAPTGLR